MVSETKAKFQYSFPLRAEGVFCDLSPETLESLAAIKQTKRFRKHSRLFTAGDMPCCIYRLVSGRARLFIKDASNNKRVIRFIAQDEIFGLTEAIANIPYETNAETVTACLCECFGREDFIRFLHDEPQICFRLVKLLGSNLQRAVNSYFLQ